jgi:hypothetical protein
LQCEFLKLLYEKLCDLHDAYGDSPRAVQFPRPSFKVREIGLQKKCFFSVRARASGCALTPPPSSSPPKSQTKPPKPSRSSSCGATRPLRSPDRSCARVSPASTTGAWPMPGAGGPLWSSARRTRTSTRRAGATACSSSTTGP